MSETPKQLAILFADLGGSTRLYDTLGDAEARRIIGEYVAQIIDEARVAGGTIIKTIGDEVMCSFPDVDGALDAAVAIVRSVESGTTTGIGVHVGTHFGAVIIEKDDVFGDTVNVAARVVSLANDGEILITRQVVDRLAPDREALTRLVDRRSMKGREEKVEIYSLVAPQDDLLTTVNFDCFDADNGREQSVLTLRLGEVEMTLDADRPAATIGRHTASDLVLPDLGASRRHARLELRHGKFYLCDQSTNGTVLRTQNEEPTFLRREEAILVGSGQFGLSCFPDTDPATPIYFEVRSDRRPLSD